MIADPVNSRLQTILGLSVTSNDVTIDMIAFGPGSKTSRKLNVGTNWQSALVAGKLIFEHSETKGGRQRSVLRVDIEGSRADVGLPAPTASAYLVFDRPLALPGGALDKITLDAALALLFNACVTSRAAGANDIVFTQLLKDWYGGEP